MLQEGLLGKNRVQPLNVTTSQFKIVNGYTAL